mmetsp:Transcript_47060/g.106114  ORF Transcript_47060/g.106114 Transcript_47060/m.106114 type:complete len:250 (+) Transcript_47060:931-1680(+)
MELKVAEVILHQAAQSPLEDGPSTLLNAPWVRCIFWQRHIQNERVRVVRTVPGVDAADALAAARALIRRESMLRCACLRERHVVPQHAPGLDAPAATTALLNDSLQHRYQRAELGSRGVRVSPRGPATGHHAYRQAVLHRRALELGERDNGCGRQLLPYGKDALQFGQDLPPRKPEEPPRVHQRGVLEERFQLFTPVVLPGAPGVQTLRRWSARGKGTQELLLAETAQQREFGQACTLALQLRGHILRR